MQEEKRREEKARVDDRDTTLWVLFSEASFLFYYFFIFFFLFLFGFGFGFGFLGVSFFCFVYVSALFALSICF